jgi:hypothetical protein
MTKTDWTAEEVRRFAVNLRYRDYAESADVMDAFAERIEADESAVPFGWVFQHGDTGLMCFCENDGVNNPENFAANNPRHHLCGPAYAHPPAQATQVNLLYEAMDGRKIPYSIPAEPVGVPDVLTADVLGSWCNILTHAWMHAQEGNRRQAWLGIEQIEKEMRGWQRKLAAPPTPPKEN